MKFGLTLTAISIAMVFLERASHPILALTLAFLGGMCLRQALSEAW